MSKVTWKAGNFLYPLPAVMVSCGTMEILNTNPAMVYISVRPTRYSYNIIKEQKEFVINLTTKRLAKATDWCGVKTGAKVDKFKEMNLTPVMGTLQYAPMLAESPVCIECKVDKVMELGTHDMFMAKVTAVHADEQYLDKTGRFDLNKARPLVYSHGFYYGVGEKIGKFGYSVQKKKS